MPLWFFQLLLFACVVFALLFAMSRRVQKTSESNDLSFYKSLLSEIETSPFENEQERENARLEVSCKILATAPTQQSTQNLKAKRVAIVLLLTLLPASTYALYAHLGSPNLPATPLVGRAMPPNSPVLSLISKVETHLAKNPDDVKGWEVLAPVYTRIENFEAAVEARRNILRLLGSSPERINDYAESLFLRNNGVISAQIESLFKETIKLDASDLRANYYLALAMMQDGKKEAALEKWEALLKNTNKEEEKTFLRQEIDRHK